MAQAYGAQRNVPLFPDRAGELVVVTDTAANDSAKTITVPAGFVWQVKELFVSLASTATVGNRQMLVAVADGSAVALGYSAAAAVQTASGTEYYTFSPRFGSATETPATYHFVPFPVEYLGPTWTVTISDSAAIDAAADDMVVALSVIQYEA